MRTQKIIVAGALTAAAVYYGRRAVRRRRRISFSGRVAIVTGGSRGLGLAMARELAMEGASVVLLARDHAELEEARRDLKHAGASGVSTLVCDVGDRDAVESAIDTVFHEHGRLDLLINNAGVIQIGPLEHMQIADFEEAMAVHFWGPLYAMRRAIPIMRQQGGGRIVNISSVGGKVAVPHLAPYIASKFALTGLSDTARAELARDSIRITTVAPGLVRTGSHVNTQVKGQHRHEFAWFAFGAGAPMVSQDVNGAARRIIEAARDGKKSLDLGWPARALVALNGLTPELIGNAMVLANDTMPEPIGPEGDQAHSGYESRSDLAPSAFTHRADREILRNNQ